MRLRERLIGHEIWLPIRQGARNPEEGDTIALTTFGTPRTAIGAKYEWVPGESSSRLRELTLVRQIVRSARRLLRGGISSSVWKVTSLTDTQIIWTASA